MDSANRLLFFWILIMAIVSSAVKPYRTELVEGKEQRRIRPLFALIVFLPIIYMAAYGRPRSDTYLYLYIYRTLPNTLTELFKNVQYYQNKGFVVFEVLIRQVFGGSERAFRVALALIHAIPVIYVIRKYSENYILSIYLFLATGCHLGWMMNGVRQFMAVTIIFAATPWILEKKYVKAILVILLAATIHRTALVMIPVVFIIQGEAWNWKTVLFSVAISIATVVFAGNEELFDNFAESVGYSLEAAKAWGDDGANPIRVLVNAVPMILAWRYRKKIKSQNSRMLNICVNMSVITTGMYLVAMVTSGIMVGRMPIYTSLYNLILLPYILKCCFKGGMRQIVTLAAVVLYFIYFLLG